MGFDNPIIARLNQIQLIGSQCDRQRSVKFITEVGGPAEPKRVTVACPTVGTPSTPRLDLSTLKMSIAAK